MKTLILKNVQEIDSANKYSPSVDLAQYICGGNVNYLDLSYNYIVSVEISQWCWNSKLRYLNIDRNFIAANSPEGSYIFVKAIPILSGLEVFQGNVWTDATFQDGLWDDSNIVDYSNKDSDTELSLLSKFLQHTPFGFLAGYDYWLTDVMKHCGNIKYLDVVRCAGYQKEDLCSFLKCVAPEFDIHDCVKKDAMYELQYFAKTMCTYKQCAYNIPFTLPPQLRSIRLNNFGKYTKGVTDPQLMLYKICFYPNNNLEVLDLPNLNFKFPQTFTGVFNIHGLRKLRFLNLQGHKLLVPLSQVVLHDMESLTELHVGGNSLAHNNIILSNFLHTYTKLSILNLSSAYLVGIEPDVFANIIHLSVLDLSYNQLNSSALSSIDWSHTHMKSLNLSHT